MKRKIKAIWNGDGSTGSGYLTAQSGAFNKMPYTFKTRFENDEGLLGTNPEELIAAAHAGCFNMKLSFVLNEAGFNPEELNTDATLIFEDGKIIDVIKMGRNHTKEEVIESAIKANAHQFIQNLPNQYETYITERGANFSGGQIQRIAIARAILGNPSILLLDEATSALDAESESEVQEGLNRAMKNRTVIVIAHRLATTQEADKIVVFDKGRIIEIGKHIDLLKNEAIYKELCEKQLIKKL